MNEQLAYGALCVFVGYIIGWRRRGKYGNR